MPKKTKTVKVLELYETTIEVPVGLSKDEQRDYAYNVVKRVVHKPVRVTAIHTEDVDKVWEIV